LFIFEDNKYNSKSPAAAHLILVVQEARDLIPSMKTSERNR
jgi:hypothetical protein